MFTLVWAPSFTREARRFLRKHPDLRVDVEQALQDLEIDPFQSHLKLHPLRGQLEGMHAISVTYSHRIILILQVTEREITLLDIGSHDDVYR